jgi:hypothetical protein
MKTFTTNKDMLYNHIDAKKIKRTRYVFSPGDPSNFIMVF